VKLDYQLALFFKAFRYCTSYEGPYLCREVCFGLKVASLNNVSGTPELSIRFFMYPCLDVLHIVVTYTDSDRQTDENGW
jgi:hypothetical protein